MYVRSAKNIPEDELAMRPICTRHARKGRSATYRRIWHFAAIYWIISGFYLGDVFIWCAQLSIRFPGLIFTWDLDGIMWLIGMKILFAILGS